MTNDVRVPEVALATMRSHPRALFWPSFVLVAISGGTMFFVGLVPEAWQKVALMTSAGLMIIVLWMIPLLAWLGRSYTITSRRIVFRSGLFVRVRREFLHSRGYHVVVRQNALQRVFGSGDLQITIAHDQWITMKDVPDVDLVQEALHDVAEASARPGV